MLGTFPDDPDFKNCGNDNRCKVGWGLSVTSSSNIHITGAGLYSWYYDSYKQDCVEARNCQDSVARVLSCEPSVSIFNLVTTGTTYMLSTDSPATSVRADANVVLTDSPWLCEIAGWTAA
jgi:hypothetical protein